VALGTEHLSSYEVIYEEDTALYAQMKAREFDVDEDLACDMYEEFGGARGLLPASANMRFANFARE